MKNTNPADYEKMTLEELGQAFIDANETLKVAEDEKKGLGQLLVERMKEEKQDGFMVGNTALSRRTMTRYNTTLEEARVLGATKMEEKPDTVILKQLDQKGITVPGKAVIEFVVTKEVEE